MEKKIENRVKRSLEIEKEGDVFVSVVKKEFDFSDKGYFTSQEQRMKVLTKEFCESTITDIGARLDKITSDVASNDEFLAKIEGEYKKHWDSKDFNIFMKNYERKYAKLIKWKSKYDEFMTKQVQNEQFKVEESVEKEFKAHYEEMLSKWD